MTTSLQVIRDEKFYSLYIVFALNLLALSAALLWDGSDQDVLIPVSPGEGEGEGGTKPVIWVKVSR